MGCASSKPEIHGSTIVNNTKKVPVRKSSEQKITVELHQNGQREKSEIEKERTKEVDQRHEDGINQYDKIDEHAKKVLVRKSSEQNIAEELYQNGKPEKPGREKERTKEVDQRHKDGIYQYDKIDEHAKKAPSNLTNSPEGLVNYLSTVSKDHRMLARGIFVWISENIKYDVDGYFGRSSRAPCDAESVMKGGSSVCEGYANVMELLCRLAGVPVKKISGFAKGYSHSAANPYTVNTKTNHAWNTIQLNGKWYLIDSTWGAGHLGNTNTFKKELDDFYFLTDPQHLISTHFPYMDNNMEESQKWQLLSKPVSLDEFNKYVKYMPMAFKLGAKAVSHQNEYIEMKNELEMTFKCVGSEELVLSAILMLKDGNWLREQPNTTFGYPENRVFKLLIHPPKPGIYKMIVFGKTVSDESLQGIPEIMEYMINCTAVEEKDFEYPTVYGAAGKERSILHEPRKGNLPGNTEVKFRVSAPDLQNVRVSQTYLEKSGTMFSGCINVHRRIWVSDFHLWNKRGQIQ